MRDDRQSMGDVARATVKVYLDGHKAVEATAVDSVGLDDLSIPALPAVTLDKLLIDLSNNHSARAKLFGQFRNILTDAVKAHREGEKLAVDVPLLERERSRRPDVSLTIEMRESMRHQRFGAKSTSRPRWRTPIPYPTLAGLSLRSFFQWSVDSLRDRDAAEMMLTVLARQYDYYDDYGFPGVRDVGRAPFFATMAVLEHAIRESVDGDHEYDPECRACGFVNDVESEFCGKCRAPLRLRE